MKIFQSSTLFAAFWALSFNALSQSFFNKHTDINPFHYEVIKEQAFQKAAVTSAHPLASMVGAAIMKDGGNAFDAAIAVQFSLAVVFPGAGNIGGGGFMLARDAKGKLLGLDYREAAPAKAHRDMYLDSSGNPIAGMSRDATPASGVPGSVAGMFSMLQYAKLPMSQLIEPAIELAEFGFVITEKEARGLNNTRSQFIKNSSSICAFTAKEKWNAGDTLIQIDLANTLKRIAKKGKAGFYEGETADLIVKEMAFSKGFISKSDLKNYTPKWRKPIEFDYRGHHIISFSPPSSGGIIIGEMLQMLSPFNISEMGPNTAKSVNLMVEAQRRAYADRAEHMGDPDFYPVPTTGLLSTKYAIDRMKDFQEGVAGVSKNIKAGLPSHESEQTTHFSVIDENGTMIAITTTLNDTYGNKTIVGGAGFLLNNEMDDFSIKPGVPNMFGAIGGEANAIQPGKRMLSSMTPTLVTINNQPYITIGSPGGTTIPNQVFEGLVNIIDHKMTLKQAVDAPRFHHQWLPDNIATEMDFPEATIESLKAMGYTLVKRGYFGRMDGIMILPNGNRMAAGDKRGDDSVAGF